MRTTPPPPERGLPPAPPRRPTINIGKSEFYKETSTSSASPSPVRACGPITNILKQSAHTLRPKTKKISSLLLEMMTEANIALNSRWTAFFLTQKRGLGRLRTGLARLCTGLASWSQWSVPPHGWGRIWSSRRGLLRQCREILGEGWPAWTEHWHWWYWCCWVSVDDEAGASFCQVPAHVIFNKIICL